MAENRVEGSKIGKKITMRSDVTNTANVVTDSEAESVDQQIDTGQGQKISIFGFGKASGRVAVIALTVVVVLFLIYKFLLHKF